MTVAAGDTTNKAIMTAGLAVMMLALTFALVSDAPETDAAKEGELVQFGGIYYVTVYGDRTYTDSSLNNEMYIYVVGNGSDIGGGASIMGTLSGGGKHRVSIGEHSLLGANAGIGISLGDNCVVEAGLYVTAGTKITVVDKAKQAAGEPLDVVKGAELSGKDNILFIRNSLTGAIEARYRKTGIELNSELHQHN